MMKLRNVLALIATVAAINARSAEPQSILLASTTSVEASGLLANILPQFTARTGIEVRVVAVGSSGRYRFGRRRNMRHHQGAVGVAIMDSPQRHDSRADDAAEQDGDDGHAEVTAQARRRT